MLVPFLLTLLLLLTVLFRLCGHLFGRQWGNYWWTLILVGTAMLFAAMVWTDLSGPSRPFSSRDKRLLAMPLCAVVACWFGVASHISKIHAHRWSCTNPRQADLVMDICLYPIILSLLTCHSACALLVGGDALDASTTLAATGIFESWALASVLTLFESFVQVGLWMRIGVYQFLVLNAAASGAAFYLKGFAPCSLCYQFGAPSCATLAHTMETLTLASLKPSIANWRLNILLDVPLLGLVLAISSTLAIGVMVALEMRHHAKMFKAGDVKMWILPYSLRGSLVKLLGVKLIVTVIFLQPYVLKAIQSVTENRLSISLNVAFWNVWLLSIEAYLLHLFHLYCAYPCEDFLPGGILGENILQSNSETAEYGTQGPRGPDSEVGGGEEAQPPNPGQSNTQMTWMEKFMLLLAGLFLLASWASVSSLISMGSCRPEVLHGSVGGLRSGPIRACEVAPVTCNAAFAADLTGSRGYSATCGQDGHFVGEGRTGKVLGCTTCAPGHFNYPSCTPCTNEQHCSGHADSVSDDGSRTGCSCECRNNWSGPGCKSCSVGHVTYPDCAACSSTRHCNGHAVNVTDDGTRTRCICTCDSKWAGADCSVCAAGHISYPGCVQCTSEQHCNGNAISVTDDGSRQRCACTCKRGWTGDTCNLPVTVKGCACKSQWDYCGIMGLNCATYRGCPKSSSWMGRSWCMTEPNCEINWDYC